MPRLWKQTVEAHRRSVRDAILDTTVELVADHGVRSVTMSQIAEVAGIGRATLYKYFSDVEAILLAWHERQVTDHVRRLTDIRDQVDEPAQRLAAVLEAYALMTQRSSHHTEMAAILHRHEHVGRAQRHVRAMVRELLTEAVLAGAVRDDIAADELATYCLHALGAATTLQSKAAIRRLVNVTLSGLRPADGTGQA